MKTKISSSDVDFVYTQIVSNIFLGLFICSRNDLRKLRRKNMSKFGRKT